MKKTVLIFLFLALPPLSWGLGNETVANFAKAKKLAAQIHEVHPYTIYCPCRYQGKTVDLTSCGYQAKTEKGWKRAARIEWEHVVPAENFGQSFQEWREGAPACVKNGKTQKGRKCAETNPEFARMEADLYNLWPAVGELNGLRSNLSMAQIRNSKQTEGDFGGCKALIRERKFEPMDQYKGIVARTYFYMESQYPDRGIISNKNRKLYEAWDKLFPVSPWECDRAKRIQAIQGNSNAILESRCKQLNRSLEECTTCTQQRSVEFLKTIDSLNQDFLKTLE